MPNQTKDRLRRPNPTGGKPFQGTPGNPASYHPFRVYWYGKKPCRITGATRTTFTIWLGGEGKPFTVPRKLVRKQFKPARTTRPYTKRQHGRVDTKKRTKPDDDGLSPRLIDAILRFLPGQRWRP